MAALGSARRVLHGIGAVTAAGLLWLLGCLPVVTAVPATAALFAVAGGWSAGRPTPVWPTFWSGMRSHFRQGLAFTALGAAAAIIVVANITFALNTTNGLLRAVSTIVATLIALAALGTGAFLFPVMTTYPAPWMITLRNASLLAASCPGTTFTSLAVLGVAAIVTYLLPILLPITGGLAALAIAWMATRAFARVITKQAMLTAESPRSAA